MNQYNPSIEVSAADRFQQRSKEAENARLAASVKHEKSPASDLFDRVKNYVEELKKSRAASGQKRLRPL